MTAEENTIVFNKVKELIYLASEQKKGKEGINIFDVLDLKSKETRHSMMIAELLDPAGSHGCGDVFLDDFTKTVFKEDEFSVPNARIRTEDSIGDKGRLDIILRSANGSSAIIIENKIYAGDQMAQLARYHEYATGQFKDFRILYLTLNGKTASNESSCGLGIGANGYIPISYEKHIIGWLELCLAEKDLEGKPRVKDIIQQYLETVKRITNQDMELTLDEILSNVFVYGEKADGIEGIVKYSEFKENVKSVLNNLEQRFDEYLLAILKTIDKGVERQPNWPSWITYVKKNGIEYVHIFREKDILYCGLALSEPDRYKDLVEQMTKDGNVNNAYFCSFEANSKGYKEALIYFKELVDIANETL